MKLCFTFLLASLLLFISLPVQAMNEVDKKAVDQLIKFLDRVVTLSSESPPPAMNASSGIFHDSLLSDATVLKIRKSLVPESGADGLQVACFMMVDETLKSFRGSPNVYCSVDLDPVLNQYYNNPDNTEPARSAFEEGIKKIPAITSAIISRGSNEGFLCDPQTTTSLTTGVVESIRKRYLLNTSDARGFMAKTVYTGSHMNPSVAFDEAESAKKIRAKLSSDQGDNEPIANVLRIFCIELETIKSKTYTPWIGADWQLSFEKSCAVAALVLESASSK